MKTILHCTDKEEKGGEGYFTQCTDIEKGVEGYFTVH